MLAFIWKCEGDLGAVPLGIRLNLVLKVTQTPMPTKGFGFPYSLKCVGSEYDGDHFLDRKCETCVWKEGHVDALIKDGVIGIVNLYHTDAATVTVTITI